MLGLVKRLKDLLGTYYLFFFLLLSFWAAGKMACLSEVIQDFREHFEIEEQGWTLEYLTEWYTIHELYGD